MGCEPGDPWAGVADCVKALRDDGHRVSIDSWQPREVAAAVRAGAELVLSVNSSNRTAACDWGCEVVVVPDEFSTLAGLDDTVQWLTSRHVPLRIDPVLEPIGCGFAASLGRYLEVRRRFPGEAMLLGIGNLTELTDVDSAGVNVLLLGFCQELGIRSVLTTQVINWARTSVRECDLARRLVHYAVGHGIPPKHLESRLVALRDVRVHEFGHDELERLAQQIRDHSFRIFSEQGRLQVVGSQLHLQGTDPFELCAQLLAQRPGARRSCARVLPGLRVSQGPHGVDVGQGISPGRGSGLGIPDRGRGPAPTQHPPEEAESMKCHGQPRIRQVISEALPKDGRSNTPRPTRCW